jgi:hypothetical protein
MFVDEYVSENRNFGSSECTQNAMLNVLLLIAELPHCVAFGYYKGDAGGDLAAMCWSLRSQPFFE